MPWPCCTGPWASTLKPEPLDQGSATDLVEGFWARTSRHGDKPREPCTLEFDLGRIDEATALPAKRLGQS